MPWIRCPSCENRLRIPRDFRSGKKASCPVCQEIFRPRKKKRRNPAAAALPTPSEVTPISAEPVLAAASPVPRRRRSRTPVVEMDSPIEPVSVEDIQLLQSADAWIRARHRRAWMWRGAGVVAALALVGYFVVGSVAMPFWRKPVYPVTGLVQHEGKPATGAVVMLFPEDGKDESCRPRGMVRGDGTFVLSTYQFEDGAPPGRYRVAIHWPHYKKRTPRAPAVAPANERPKATIAAAAREADCEALLKKYGDAETSGLQAEVQPQPMNQLGPFELR